VPSTDEHWNGWPEMEQTDWTERDALLLAFAELAGYGIATVPGAGTAARARWEILAALRERSPCALGRYVFWGAGDEHLFAGGGRPPLYTSGADVERALAAALTHQGLRADARSATGPG
jgi:hypothetical protein